MEAFAAAFDPFAFVLVFARLGTAMMIMPALGESFILARARLGIALAITVIVLPFVGPLLPPAPTSPWLLIAILGVEMAVGAFIGLVGRIMIASLAMAGMVIAYQSALANAFTFNPVAAEQGALAGAFLTVTGLLLIFVTDLHHMLIAGLIDSYRLYVPGQVPPVGDFSEAIARTVAESFLLAMQIAAPFVIAGLLLVLGTGLLNRLMPQVQMFFVVMPVQIAMGSVLLMLLISALVLWFLDRFADTVGGVLL